MVSTIFAYGEDALNTEATARLQLPSFLMLDDIDSFLSFRATGIRSPELEIKTYTRSFRGYQMEVWKPGRDPKTVDLTFRVDKYFRVYDTIYDWMLQIVNLENGSYISDSSSASPSLLEQTARSVIQGAIQAASGINLGETLRGTLTISQENVSGDILGKGWTYEGVWPKVLPSIDYDTTSDGTPISVTVTFGYITAKRSS